MKKKLFLGIFVCLTVILAVIFICDFLVNDYANGKMYDYDNMSDIPRNKYGLLLGTSPVTRWGTHNFYFDNRIDAADRLYRAGKIDTIIVSGGDYRMAEKYGCDEPAVMRDSLVARGISSDRIILDYDGIRTMESFRKAKHVYGLDSLTVISQFYHNSRALYLAKHFDIEAVAFNAKEPSYVVSKVRNHAREYLARVKLFIDVAMD